MSVGALMKQWKDPGIDERQAGAALRELVKRGIDPKTGKNVGRSQAAIIAAEIGESSPG